LAAVGNSVGGISLTPGKYKILFLLTQDLESPSGLGRYWPVARALATRGHQVRIATLHSNWTALTLRKFEREGVTVEYVAPMHVKKNVNKKLYYSPVHLLIVSLRATWALSWSALSAPVDIIHVGKPHPMNSIAGFLASRIKGSILCLDCDDYEAGSNRFEKRWQETGVAYFEKRIPRISRLVTTNTLFMKSKLLSWGCPTERIFYLSNGIERQRFLTPDPVEISRLRIQLGLDGKRVVLYVGSLSLPSHPVDLLLESFSQVFRKYPDSVLLLVGGGEDYQKLKDLSQELGISQVTHFTGRVSSVEVAYYYGLADVSVDPVYDNDAARGRSPLKLFESWACGVPFVTAPVGDREFLLGQPPAGILAQFAGDSGSLAASIIEVLESKNKAEELCRRGKEQIEQYTWDRLAAQLEQEYQKYL
jgi:glycosyltransferase involved in cell wall biosynthesis